MQSWLALRLAMNIGKFFFENVLELYLKLINSLTWYISFAYYRMVGSKLMMTTKSAYAKQRCSKAWRPTEESDCDDFYRSKKKQALAMKFRKMGK